MANEKTFQSRIQLKHDTSENWGKAINFIPKAGEVIIYDADADNPVRYKIGDGVTNVNKLPFATGTAVLYTLQTLTTDQKEQARANIDAISIADIPEVPVTSVAGKTGAVILDKSDVGLSNVTNESKATMFASPAFTGTPTAPTATKGTNTTQVATTAFVGTAIGDKANTSTTITAGNGLTGGGTLASNRTLAVGAGNGISVAADAVAVKAGTGITVDTNGVNNAGVRAITQDATNGHKLTVNTGGTSTTITIPDNNTTYTAGTALTLDGTEFNHDDYVTAGTVQGNSGAVAYGGTITIPKVTYNAQGHITSTGTTTITLPAKVTAADLGLEQVMKFLGTSGIAITDGDTDPNITIGGQAVVAELGNVVLYNGKEYVFSSAGWEELGDEGSHALKSITISAGNGLTGGGNLSANRAISAKAGTGITVDSSGIHNAGVRSITQNGTDGHKLTINTGGTNATITIPDNDTTYDVATTSAAGLMSATDKTFIDGAQAQIDGKMNATNPTGSGSLSIGRKANTTVGENSIALGTNATAVGKNSVAIGNNTSAGGDSSFAEGDNTIAYGLYSHAEGWNTEAQGAYSHAEGYRTYALYDGGHSEGSESQAHGVASHAEGWTTIANGIGAHAEGFQTQTSGGDGSHAQGKWNLTDIMENYAHVVGNGDSATRSNAHTLDWSGNAWFAGDVYVGSTSGTNKDNGSVKLATVTEVPTIEIIRW